MATDGQVCVRRPGQPRRALRRSGGRAPPADLIHVRARGFPAAMRGTAVCHSGQGRVGPRAQLWNYHGTCIPCIPRGAAAGSSPAARNSSQSTLKTCLSSSPVQGCSLNLVAAQPQAAAEPSCSAVQLDQCSCSPLQYCWKGPVPLGPFQHYCRVPAVLLYIACYLQGSFSPARTKHPAHASCNLCISLFLQQQSKHADTVEYAIQSRFTHRIACLSAARLLAAISSLAGSGSRQQAAPQGLPPTKG